MDGSLLRRHLLLSGLAIGLATSAACGSSSPSSPSSDDVTITISASGVTPTEVHVGLGGHVTFFNTDSRPHAMSSDPVQLHTDCPPINEVGFLNPGQRAATGSMAPRRTCGFHDHTNENDPIFKGRIIVD